MSFKLLHTCKNTKARVGEFYTDHGVIKTPIFMPVGTQGTVKGISQEQLNSDISAQIILGNTYHLYLRPGTDIIQESGGLHSFINWKKPILTDSGGYQVFSLSDRRKLDENGVQFKSHIDGSKHLFTPENAIDIQRKIGADIIMAFDECTPYPCEYKYAKESLKITHQWLDRCIVQMQNSTPLYNYNQALFPIVQGSIYKDLRIQSAEYISNKNASGNAIGGLSVGEPHEDLYSITELVCSILPEHKPRYLMGVGTPENIINCISLGIDMFDCVMPTRNGRNGTIFTKEGKINFKNRKWAYDFSPVDEELMPQYSKAYIRHLICSGEMLGSQLCSLFNLKFYLWLVTKAREKIEEGTFYQWKNVILPKLSNKL